MQNSDHDEEWKAPLQTQALKIYLFWEKKKKKREKKGRPPAMENILFSKLSTNFIALISRDTISQVWIYVLENVQIPDSDTVHLQTYFKTRKYLLLEKCQVFYITFRIYDTSIQQNN